MTHYRSSNFFIIITSPNFQITTSFSQNPSLKLFILCSNFLFIFLNFFTCWIYSPIKEKWIQHFFLLQADPHTPQNASPPSQKIDWTFSQNKTFSKIFKLINCSFFHSYFHSFMYRVYIEGNHHSKNEKEWYREGMIEGKNDIRK